MIFKNDGVTEDEILQNTFTAYLQRAVSRRRKDYLWKLVHEQMARIRFCRLQADRLQISERDLLPMLLQINNFNNDDFAIALQQLSYRELYIVLSVVIGERDYEDLSEELKLPYKTVATIYYRAKKKVRNNMECIVWDSGK